MNHEKEHDMDTQKMLDEFDTLSPEARADIMQRAQDIHLEDQANEGWIRWEAAPNGTRNRAIARATRAFIDEWTKPSLINVDSNHDDSVVFEWSDGTSSIIFYSQLGPLVHGHGGSSVPSDPDGFDYQGENKVDVNDLALEMYEEGMSNAVATHVDWGSLSLSMQHEFLGRALVKIKEKKSSILIEPDVLQEARALHQSDVDRGAATRIDWDDLSTWEQQGYVAQARKVARKKKDMLIDTPEWGAAQAQVGERAKELYDAETTEGSPTWETLAGHQQSRWVQRAMGELYPVRERARFRSTERGVRPVGRHQQMASEALRNHEELEGYDAQLSAKWAAVHASLAVVEETRALHETMTDLTKLMEKLAAPPTVVNIPAGNGSIVMDPPTGLSPDPATLARRVAQHQAGRRVAE